MKLPDPWAGYVAAALAAAACTGLGLAMTPRFDVVNVAMVYLLAVVVVALRFTRGPAVASAALSVAAFDLVFVPPQGRLTVNDVQYLFTFAILLLVALVITRLMERARAEAAENARLGAQAETERMRSALLASISHDLRSPLAVLTGASSTLAETGERLAPEERTALARSLYGQARDLSEQMDKVLQMTRIETGALPLERDWAAPDEIVAGALARLSDRLATHRVLAEISPDLPLLRVDAAWIEQALVNLLDNAARHTPPGTVVRVRARRVADDVVLGVEDTGAGLDAEARERLFAKFERGAPERGARGVGLGLAIARAIVGLHGGRAWAEPGPGGGLAVLLALPVEAAPAPPADEGDA